jgi:hypothetical protein
MCKIDEEEKQKVEQRKLEVTQQFHFTSQCIGRAKLRDVTAVSQNNYHFLSLSYIPSNFLDFSSNVPP